jgi:hypothetical protein
MKPISSARLLQKLAGQDVSAKTYTAINAATQDAVKIQGRAGGTSGYAVTLTPGTLTATRTITLPDLSGTAVVSGAGQAVSLGSLVLGTDFGGSGLLRVGGDIRSQKIILRDNGIEETATNATAAIEINYNGYAVGTSQFRSFDIYNGKQTRIATFDGPSSAFILGTDPNPGGYELLRAGGQIRLSWSGANPYSNDAAGLRVSGNNGGMITLENGAVGSWTIWGQNASNDLFIGNGATGGSRTNRMIIDGYGNVGIGGAPVNGNGKLQLPPGTTKSDGIAFGTDNFLHRAAGHVVELRQAAVAAGGGAYLQFYDSTNAAYRGFVGYGTGILTSATASTFGLRSNGDMMFSTNGGYVAITIDTSQNTDHAGNCGVASGKVYKVNGTQVVSARRTGWTAQTATASRADLGASPTVGAIASFLRALYDDLAAHGLIGA